jgi:flagellar biosynthetic protein FlhB
VAEDRDQASKTEEATPRKLEEARKRGDVARSPDVSAWTSLAAAVGVLAVGGAWFMQQISGALLPFIAAPHELIGGLESGAALDIVRGAFLAAAPMLGILALATILAGVGGTFAQQGLVFTGEKIKPSIDKINPVKGLGRIFGIDGLAQFLKTLIKLACVCATAWLVLSPHASELQRLAAMPPTAALGASRDILLALALSVLALLGAVAALDYIWQRARFLRRMRMSREELRDEFRQSEGDPLVKARLRQIRMERARRRMMAAVPDATVVITNPTHFAVALKYVAGETAAPVCLAKGMDTLALKIREVAAEAGVPVVEDPPLARALFAAVEVDETIPREHYEAVAKVIGFVMNAGRRARPVPL